jgi:hypothetical protein
MRETFELHYMSVPENGELTPAAALEWLSEWASDWLNLVGMGCEVTDDEVRSAYRMLSLDVGTMIGACAKALAIGGSARVSGECRFKATRRTSSLRSSAFWRRAVKNRSLTLAQAAMRTASTCSRMT